MLILSPQTNNWSFIKLKSADEIAKIVDKNMPHLVNFLSRKKLYDGFNIACSMIEDLSVNDNGEVDMVVAIEAVDILASVNHKLLRASYIATLFVDQLPEGHLNKLAFTTAHKFKNKF